jgi:hypothetical protein
MSAILTGVLHANGLMTWRRIGDLAGHAVSP